MFESGLFEAPADRLVSHIVRRMQSLSEPARAFGWSAADKGILGATPEVLFSTDGVRFTTMALAGTRPSARAEELLDDPKERDEHQIVIEDIKDRLQPDGAVTVGRTGVMVFSGLAHLLTDITFEPPHPQRFGFDEMIRRLHPTAALGASPRSDESARWLREADRGVGRGFFGAPFGFQRADGSGLCIVAIRSLTWRGGLARIGSGAGIVSQSSMDAEFEELRRKREQVKRLLGLDGGSV
jgi:menaquinone-specific isochorismate synthase